MRTTRLITIGFICFFVLGIAGQTFAACTGYFKVNKIYSRTTGSYDYSYFYLTPRGAGPYVGNYYYGRTSSLTAGGGEASSTLKTAYATNDTVYVYGTASTCPTGTARYMGDISYTYVYKNY
ncbi:hypothetical protein [Desulfogranum marinum]|uniref:hypothetical protein n=1 Tax=Desulfogranum marinum TaxID=453220 RepID=UPI001965CD21|nr:hypothetical protein [Desulfogranum marinum]MBM9513025.1 hypothetical protein [Desulfogranum marinum]